MKHVTDFENFLFERKRTKEEIASDIKKGRELKDKMRKGLVKAKLENGDIVVVSSKNQDSSAKKFIRYKDKKTGKIVKAFDYELIDEYIKK